jgi:CRP/FNR family cyclic AMP-dependent transcriptional regulator
MPNSKDPAHTQQLSILRSAGNGLQHLTANDWVLLVDRAKKTTIPKGDKLIQQGKQTRVVYLVLKGKVAIEVSNVRIANVGPGQICGEMAFIEDSLASASAIAEEEVEAFTLSWGVLTDLFELYPHLASRFYRSLAVNLSRRLRDQLTSKAPTSKR